MENKKDTVQKLLKQLRKNNDDIKQITIHFIKVCKIYIVNYLQSRLEVNLGLWIENIYHGSQVSFCLL